MGSPEGFKSKKMDKEKWKRIIQPDGDSDSSLDCWDDGMNVNGGDSNEKIPTLRLYVTSRTPQANTNYGRNPEVCAGPSTGNNDDPNNREMIESGPPVPIHDGNETFTPPVPPHAPGLTGMGPQDTVTSSSAPERSSNPMPMFRSNKHRRVHFHDSVSLDNRMIKLRERMNSARPAFRNDPCRLNPKDQARCARTPSALNSSIASLRSMMRCGNNPDWLKLTGERNLRYRWISSPVAGNQNVETKFASDNWRVDPPPGGSNVDCQMSEGPPAQEPEPGPSTASGTSTVNVETQLEQPKDGVEPMVLEIVPEENAPDVTNGVETDNQAEQNVNEANESNTSNVDDEQNIKLPVKCSEVALNSSILSMLECPVCLEHMGPPIHQCRRGHLVCNNCRGQLLNCPTCRSRFTDLRNLALERIAELLHFPCKNEECGQTFKLRNKEQHELNCSWRSYNCMAQNCAWQGLHKSLLAHVQEEHSDLILVGDSHVLEMPLDMTFSRNYIFSAWGELFRANMQRGPGNGVINSVAQYLGPVRRANDFHFTMKLESHSAAASPTRKIVYSRTMHPDNIRLAQVYGSGDGFSVSIEQAKLFALDMRKTYLRVILEKVSPSV